MPSNRWRGLALLPRIVFAPVAVAQIRATLFGAGAVRSPRWLRRSCCTVETLK